MVGGKIYVIALAERDWVVKDAIGRELGHYSTKSEAQTVGAKLARKRKTILVIEDENGNSSNINPARSWLGRLFGR